MLAVRIRLPTEGVGDWWPRRGARRSTGRGGVRGRGGVAIHDLLGRAARYVSGKLDALRGAGVDEAARALWQLQPQAGATQRIPREWRDLVGPEAKYEEQAEAGARFHERAQVSAEPALLEVSISLLTEAQAAAPVDHRNRGVYLACLGSAYELRFQRTGVRSDINRAVDFGEEGMAAVPEGHIDRVFALTSLASSYHSRCEFGGGGSSDLERAIELGEQAATYDRRDRELALTNLASCYAHRFERDGRPGDLERAIELGEQSVSGTPKDHPARSLPLANLQLAYRLRFERDGVSSDLDRSIALGEQAVVGARDDDPDGGGDCSNLGEAYRSRFDRDGVPSDLERAVTLGERAVQATSDGQPSRVKYLSNLAITYWSGFQRGAGPRYLERAIEVAEQGLAATPDDHVNRAMYLSNLGTLYRSGFERNDGSRDQAERSRYLARAVELAEQAVAATPDEHVDRARHLSNLAGLYFLRFDAGGERIGYTALRHLEAQVSRTAGASPVHRVHAGHSAGSLAQAMDDPSSAQRLLDAAVKLLPSVVPREAGWADQEHRLKEHFGLVGEAIAAHCANGDATGAVEIAEMGRGILLAAHLDTRTDLTELEEAHPVLAQRFRENRNRLNATAAGRGRMPAENASVVADRKQLWNEHDALLTLIRQHDRFDRFHLPPRLDELRPAATGGAVVLVNTGYRRSDAIIVTADAAPVPVALDRLTLKDCMARTTQLLDATRAGSLTAALSKQRVIPEILEWLWTSTVEPVLTALPTSIGTVESKPRLWWLPTGLLGIFPLHAAGLPGRPGALDHAVSSYAPTLRTLADSRSRPAATTRRQLTVAIERTPGRPDLPHTVTEAASLHAHAPDPPPLIGEDANLDNVLTALHSATWAHFACHASADLAAPSRGGLRLADGTLSIPDVSRLHLTAAELAYLSACSTADRGVQHADEVIHLASAFHLAGFRHVIASLWPLDDPLAAVAAHAFYRRLPDTPAADRAALALHHATRELREAQPDRPDLWSSLVHSGP
ncbi:CHAT domain-containing protein [Streptomyces sp. NPDC059989]|uniref:CHAT domain-containing tetratricopeptide repeat protein n=1 Tax=Streptomyces sp. NPDC059989 TaxID=3347026 RepID=UPI0036AFA1D9